MPIQTIGSWFLPEPSKQKGPVGLLLFVLLVIIFLVATAIVVTTPADFSGDLSWPFQLF
jgi:hypothetical protein